MLPIINAAILRYILRFIFYNFNVTFDLKLKGRIKFGNNTTKMQVYGPAERHFSERGVIANRFLQDDVR